VDLTFSESEAAFRDEPRGWLERNPPDPEPLEGGEAERFAWRRGWQRRLYDGAGRLRAGRSSSGAAGRR
jgi:hypothetical protein